MARLTSELIVSLIDQVTAPARGISSAIDGLHEAQRVNNARLDEMRGRMVEAGAVAYGLARAISSPVKAAADFETAMNRVVALSGATDEQFAELSRQARELGRTTQFTASQAGDAMGFLAMAGFEADQILGAMPGTLQLAAAAQMDLASTADLVSNVLSGYRFEASELGRVNDVMVKTFTSSNTSLAQMGEAMSYAAPIASAMGTQFEEAAAAIGIMGNAGIQGARAGTSLNAILSGLAKPSEPAFHTMQRLGIEVMDAAGNMRSLADIMVDFERGFGDLADVVLDSEGQLIDFEEAAEALAGTGDRGAAILQIFGRRGGPAFAALLGQGSDALREFEAALHDSGGEAQRVADVQMQGFNGMMREFWSVIEGLQIAIGNALLPALTSVGREIAALIGPITEFIEANPRLVATIIATTGAFVALRVAALLAQFSFLWMKGAAITSAIAGLASVRGATRATGRAFRALLNPIGLVKAAMVGLRAAVIGTGIGAVLVAIAAAGYFIYQNWQGIKEMFVGIGEGLAESFPAAAEAVEFVSDAFSTLFGWIGDLAGPIDASSEEWRGWGHAIGTTIGNVLTWIVELPGRIFDALVEGAGVLYDAGVALIQELWDGIVAQFDALLDWFRELPRRIIDAIGSIDLTGIISWPSLPSWLGGGEAEAALAGARAAGGPIARGRSYLVGEEGPEIITAAEDGYVHDAETSKAMMRRDGTGLGRAGAGLVFNIEFNMGGVHGVQDPKTFARLAAGELGRELKNIVAGLQADVEWSTS